MNREWIKAAVIRAIKTVAQTAVAMIGTATVISSVDWQMVASASVMLTEANLPEHTHGVGTLATASAGAHTHKLGRNKASVASGSKYAKPNDFEGADDTGYTSSSKGAHTHKLSGKTGSTGSGEAFSIMPPYMAVNVWTRVA